MNQSIALCNSLVIASTCLVTILGFSRGDIERKYIFNPEAILAGKEYYRLFSAAFLHADWRHLAMNMITLYLFGGTLEQTVGKDHFLLIYFGAILGGNLLSLYIHRHHDYRAYGASGGVCGVIFAYILLFPRSELMAYPLPFFVPAWLYAIGYLGASFYGMKTQRGNIGHDAHLGGAIIGALITTALYPAILRENLRVFLIVIGVAFALLIYLWRNPVFLRDE